MQGYQPEGGMLRAVGEVGFGLPFHAIAGKEGFEGFEGGAGSCTHGGSPVVGQDCPHNPRCAWAGRVSLDEVHSVEAGTISLDHASGNPD